MAPDLTPSNAGTVSKADATSMPPGWTDTYAEMGGDEEWGSVNGTGAHTSVALGLGKATPLLGRKLGEGGVLYFFAGDAKPGNIYFWEPDMGEVFRVTEPGDVDGIKKLIAAGKFKEIKREEVDGASSEQKEVRLEAFFRAEGLLE
ncbi:uncharacterized protein C8A04DRAFT_29393 [Dichotomopilus funicola]|uniref:Uncharacterized protein n=1 Tax=Dichotomopilus funicola TaxID=1934379 RepID=A0AAN6V198_9PEZI|nr:hypothetical protein C8A04DRAFT_29393 [Dichotomopilus funicola]